MSAFKNLFPSFLKLSNTDNHIQTSPRPIKYRPSSSTTILQRKGKALDVALTAATDHLSTLHTTIHTTLSTYENHYTFLRGVAHDAVNSNAALQRSQARLGRISHTVEEAFEAVDLAIQVARFKSRVNREEIERLVAENERLRASIAGKEHNANESRRKAAGTWKGAHRESGE